jgi:phosphohistidine phosphatase
MSGQSSTHQSKVTFYVMRHGMAESNANTDELRQLNEFGERQVLDTSIWFEEKEKLSHIDMAFVSPYLRAQQTYDVFKRDLSIEQWFNCDMITPDSSPNVFHDYLLGLLQTKGNDNKNLSILVVSHMPFVSLFLGELLYSGKAEIFNTGSLAIVKCDRCSLKGQLVQHYQSLIQ